MRLGADADQHAAATADGAAHGIIDHEAETAHHLLFGHMALAGQQFAHPCRSPFVIRHRASSRRLTPWSIDVPSLRAPAQGSHDRASLRVASDFGHHAAGLGNVRGTEET